MPVSNDEIVEALLRPLHESLDKQGITPEYLAKKLKRELNAKETKTIKFKGFVEQDTLRRGFKVIGTSGIIIELKDETGEKTLRAGNGDSHVAYNVIAWNIRQKARMDAHKLLNHYPPEKHELTGKDGENLTVTLKWPENGNGNGHP